MTEQEEVFKDLFPALHKIEEIHKLIQSFKCDTAFGLSKAQQDIIAFEYIQKIKERI